LAESALTSSMAKMFWKLPADAGELLMVTKLACWFAV
jgi:hypothetical protein